MEVSTNNSAVSVAGRIEIPTAKTLSAEELAADLAAGKVFAPDPHFVAALAWAPKGMSIYNRVDH